VSLKRAEKRRPRDRNHEDGFSVLEALVAMAVLAGALLPLLALQGQFVKTTESLERNEHRLSVQDLALAHIASHNLNQVSQGTLQTQYGTIEWRAEPAAGPHRARGATGFPSRYALTLYNVGVDITYNSSAAETFTLQGLGWQPVASIYDTL